MTPFVFLFFVFVFVGDSADCIVFIAVLVTGLGTPNFGALKGIVLA